MICRYNREPDPLTRSGRSSLCVMSCCCYLLVACGIARKRMICLSACGCAKLNCFIKNLPYWSDTLLLFCPFCPIFCPLTQSLIRSLNHRTGQWVVVVGQRNAGNLFDLLIWWCVMIGLMTYSIFVAIQGDYGLSRLYRRHLAWAAVRSTQEGGPNQK